MIDQEFHNEGDEVGVFTEGGFYIRAEYFSIFTELGATSDKLKCQSFNLK